jgi:hypothetical protein
MSVSGILVALRGSTYGAEYASPICLLRTYWKAILSSLRLMLQESVTVQIPTFPQCASSLSTPC